MEAALLLLASCALLMVYIGWRVWKRPDRIITLDDRADKLNLLALNKKRKDDHDAPHQ